MSIKYVICIMYFTFVACQASQEAEKGESECRCCKLWRGGMNLVIKVFNCILLQSQSFVWVRVVVFKSKFVLYQIYPLSHCSFVWMTQQIFELLDLVTLGQSSCYKWVNCLYFSGGCLDFISEFQLVSGILNKPPSRAVARASRGPKISSGF